jgi:hypothetical protein
VKGPEADLIAPYRPMTWAASSIKHHFCSTQLYSPEFWCKKQRPALTYLYPAFFFSFQGSFAFACEGSSVFTSILFTIYLTSIPFSPSVALSSFFGTLPICALLPCPASCG